jgi:hypothetical protein
VLKVLLSRPNVRRSLGEGFFLRIDFDGERGRCRNGVRLAQELVHTQLDGSLMMQQNGLIDPSYDWSWHSVAWMLLFEFLSERQEGNV